VVGGWGPHCGLPSAELLKLAGELLSVERPSGPVEESGATSRVPMEPGLIQSALDLELAEGSGGGRHPGW